MSTGEKFAAGAGKAVTDLWRGVKDFAYDAIPGEQAGELELEQEIVDSRRRDEALMSTKAGIGGNIAGNVAALLPTAFVPGANTVAGASVIGAGAGAAMPTVEGESRLKNAAMGAATGAIGQKAGGMLAKRAQNKINKSVVQKAQNEVRDEVIDQAQSAGYALPPTQVDDSATNKMLEGVSGKIMTEKKAAVNNQEVTNRLAKAAVGLSDDEPITEGALKAIRRSAGEAYKAVKNARPEYQVDDAFRQNITDIMAEYDDLVREFPSMEVSAINGLKDDLARDSFGGKALVNFVRQLRKDSTTHFKAFDNPEKLRLAQIQKGAADALEDMIERNLQGSADEALVQQYKAARQLIAKTHTIEGALENGSINAAKIGKQFAKGAPLSDELELIAQTAQSFPKATKLVTDSVNDFTLPTVAGAAYGAGSGNIPLMMLAASRPIVRKAILSKPYQNAFVNPSYSAGLAPLESRIVNNALAQSAVRSLPLSSRNFLE